MRNKNKLKQTRFFRGLTQDDIYLLTNIWPAKISRIERGVFRPTPKEKKLLSKALKTPIRELFPEA
jgi:transcriptional regulator with XRE-family HTH domain